MPAPTVNLEEGFAVQGSSVKTEFQNRLNILKDRKRNADAYFASTTSNEQNTLNGQINALKRIFADYVKSGGVENAINQDKDNNPPNGPNATITDRIKEINDKYNNYKTNVYDELKTLRQEVLATVDVNTFASNVTNQIERINTLKDQLKSEEDNLSTAYTRNKMVETQDSAVSYHQTWGFLERPLKKRSIPILIVLTVIFAVAAVIGIYLLVTMSPANITNSNTNTLGTESFTNKITGMFSRNSV